MSSRYTNLNIIKNKSGQRVDTLALQYLGDGTLWYILCLVNGTSNPFDNKFLPGHNIRIPRDTSHILNRIK